MIGEVRLHQSSPESYVHDVANWDIVTPNDRDDGWERLYRELYG